MARPVIDIGKSLGKGYKSFWQTEKKYIALAGGRASKKSTSMALKIIYDMMYMFHVHGVKPCTLVIRRFLNTHANSTKAILVKAIHMLGVEDFWEIPKSGYKLTYKPSGQVILFKGLDDPQSITSITVSVGDLCWCWFEEAYQIQNEDDFNKVEKSIRGIFPEPLQKRIYLTLNTWSDKTWIKQRFFDVLDNDPEIWHGITTFRDNEFLSESDVFEYERMRETSPRRYLIEACGEWGKTEGLVFQEEDWEIKDFDPMFLTSAQGYKTYYGMDFGQSTGYTAVVQVKHKKGENVLYICDEIYGKGMLDPDVVAKLKEKGWENEIIEADSAMPTTINNLRSYGIRRLKPCIKGNGSVASGIAILQSFKLAVRPHCEGMITELSNYSWAVDKQTGKPTGEPAKDYDHIIDALRYAVVQHLSGNIARITVA